MRPVELAFQGVAIRTIAGLACSDGRGNDPSSKIDLADHVILTVGDIHGVSVFGDAKSFRSCEASRRSRPECGSDRWAAIARIAVFSISCNSF